MVAVTAACHGLLSGQSEVTARIKSRRINLRQSLFLELLNGSKARINSRRCR